MAFVGKCNNKPSTTYDTSANFRGLLALRPGTAQQLLCKAPDSQKEDTKLCLWLQIKMKRKAYVAVTAANDTHRIKN